MMIFVTQLVLFFILFSPAHLRVYKVTRADFNSGERVYEGNLPLTRVEEDKYKITTAEGDKTFRTSGIRTMIGSYVEFETRNRDPKVRCVLDSQVAACKLFFELIHKEVKEKEKFSLSSITQLNVRNNGATTSIHADEIKGGYVLVDPNNRFVVTSGRALPEMVFSARRFNVSQRPTGDSVSVAVRVRDIQYRYDVVLQFLLKFDDEESAKSFHNYVMQKSPCTDATIPIVGVPV